MAFEKGNTYGKNTKRGKGKKTIAKESLESLHKIGINPLETSKEIIDSLVRNTELKNNEKLNLLSILTSLYKYELLTRAEEIRLDELLQENEELKIENEDIKNKYFYGSPQDLLKTLKEEK